MAGPSTAAPGNGAQRVEIHDCFSLGIPGHFLCTDAEALVNVTETRTAMIFTVHEQGTETLTQEYGSEICSSVTHYDRKTTNVVVKGDSQVTILRGGDVTVSTECLGAPAQTCTSRSIYQVANGELRYVRTDTACTPS